VVRIQHLLEFEKNSTWRFELKYRLNYLQYQKLRIAVLPYMKMDFFTHTNQNKKYLVRSLYFDTYDYGLYYEKMSGDSDRIKFRIRTYSQILIDNRFIRVELKVRKANMMKKYSLFILSTDYHFFMKNKHWPNNYNPVLAEFERYFHLRALTPQILVDYYREAYEDRIKDGLRITFDHKVRSTHSDTLFPYRPVYFREHHPLGVILEIKYHNKPPTWLQNLVCDYGLKLVANSKFTQGIQVARQDLYRPDGVVIVR